MQVATPLYPPLSGGQASTPQNRTYRGVGSVYLFFEFTIKNSLLHRLHAKYHSEGLNEWLEIAEGEAQFRINRLRF